MTTTVTAPVTAEYARTLTDRIKDGFDEAARLTRLAESCCGSAALRTSRNPSKWPPRGESLNGQRQPLNPLSKGTNAMSIDQLPPPVGLPVSVVPPASERYTQLASDLEQLFVPEPSAPPFMRRELRRAPRHLAKRGQR